MCNVFIVLAVLSVLSGCKKHDVNVGIASFQIYEKDCLEKGEGRVSSEENGDLYSGRYLNGGYPYTSTDFSYKKVGDIESARLYEEVAERLEGIESNDGNRYWFLMDNPFLAGGWLLVTEYRHPVYDGSYFYRRDFDFFTKTEDGSYYLCGLSLERISKRRLNRASNLFLDSFRFSNGRLTKPDDVEHAYMIKGF